MKRTVKNTIQCEVLSNILIHSKYTYPHSYRTLTFDNLIFLKKLTDP